MATRDRGGWTRRTLLGMVYGDPDYLYPPLRGEGRAISRHPGLLRILRGMHTHLLTLHWLRALPLRFWWIKRVHTRSYETQKELGS